MPSIRPEAASCCSRGIEAGERLAKPLDRRPRGQLLDHVAVRGGDRHLRADGRGALRDARQDRHARERAGHGAAARGRRRSETARPSRPPRRSRGRRAPACPAAARGAGPAAPRSRSCRGRRARSSSDRARPASERLRGRRTRKPSSACSTSKWWVAISASGIDAAQTTAAGPSSISRPAPTTPPAPQPIRWRGSSCSWTVDRIHLPWPRWGAPANSRQRSQGASSFRAASWDASENASTASKLSESPRRS